jgi:hypothetical protein
VISTAEIGLSFGIYLDCFEDTSVFVIFLGSPFYSRYNAEFFFDLTESNIIGIIFGKYFLVVLCIIMYVNSSQRRVHQRIEEGIVASRARIANRTVILERNVVKADVLVAPLDVINDIIQTYN